MPTQATQDIINDHLDAVSDELAEATALRNKVSVVSAAQASLQSAYDTLVAASTATQEQLQLALTTALAQNTTLEGQLTQLGIDLSTITTEEGVEEAARIAAEAALATANADLATANDDLAAALTALQDAIADLASDDSANAAAVA